MLLIFKNVQDILIHTTRDPVDALSSLTQLGSIGIIINFCSESAKSSDHGFSHIERFNFKGDIRFDQVIVMPYAPMRKRNRIPMPYARMRKRNRIY